MITDNSCDNPPPSDPRRLNSLLQTRFHGAVNIRGIRYQLLYSLIIALRLYEDEHAQGSLRIEGLEDIDLLGLHTADEYVQVKTADSPWNWAKLKQPVTSFLDVLRAEGRSQFVLAVNFSLRDDLARLAHLHTLPSSQQVAIHKKFRKLCREVGSNDAEADCLIEQMRIVSLPEEKLWTSLTHAVADAWELGSAAVDIYIAALVNNFLRWAVQRATITRSDLDRVRVDVSEALSREAEFQAYGRGLINRLSWQPDSNIADFFEAKGTRPAHIAAGLDIVRPTWLERIGNAVNASTVCVLRSSSGQGKSVLAYRYAYERWPHDETFILRVAQTYEQVELVRSYLEFRTRVGLPTYLLVDDAGYQTQMWPAVAQDCTAMGIPIVVTVRNEDWVRFARHTALRYEVLDPVLELDEAHKLFESLRAADKLHPSVDSAAWAYERIGEPRLLIEYIYLLTHGRMLEDRLRDQVMQFDRLKEDRAKTEIVRQVALADTLGAPVRARELLRSLPLSSDAQQLLQSISGEYVVLQDGVLRGLHWVRSDHLAAILHEGYPDQADTALSLVAAVPLEYLSPFVANALTRPALDGELFLQGLVRQEATMTTAALLAILNGIFEAGERRFLEANRDVFDQAYEMSGPSGAFLLASTVMPVVKVESLTELAQTVGPRFESFQKLAKLSASVRTVPRGLDLCRDFLEHVVAHVPAAALLVDLGQTGLLLDWCALAGVCLPAWLEIRGAIVADPSLMFRLPRDSFCALAQGMYRYDGATYRTWFAGNRDMVLGYLKLHTDTLSIEVTNDAVSIKFLVDTADGSDANAQAMARLNSLRSALPLGERYQAQGEWILPLGLKPTYGRAEKNMPKENLHLTSDIDKNVVWARTVETRYRPDSYYRYQEAWFHLRSDALLFVEALSTGLRHTLVGKRFDFQQAFEAGRLPERLADRLNKSPEPPPQMPESMVKMLKGSAGRWEGHFQAFFSQVAMYVEDRSDQDAGHLAVVNFRDAAALLSEMQGGFSQLSTLAADYFGASSLVPRERKAYALLGELLEVWIKDPPRIPTRDILRYLQLKRDREQLERLRRLDAILVPLQQEGVEIILPRADHFSHPFRQLALAFSVANACHPERELGLVVEALTSAREAADFFWLIPICEGVRPIPGGYSLSARRLEALERGELPNWETLIPNEVPDEIMDLLPALPYHPVRGSSARTAVLAVLLALPMLTERRKLIEELRSCESPYDGDLYQRHRAKILKAEEELVSAARTAGNELEADLGHQAASPHYHTIAAFLNTFELPMGQRPVDTGCEPNAEDLEGVAQAIETLSCKS